MIGSVALAHKAKVHRESFSRLQHLVNIPGARCASRGISAGSWPCTPAYHRSDAARQRFVDLLRANKMYVRIESASSHNVTLGCDHFRTRANHHTFTHTGLNERIARVTNPRDPPTFYSDICLNNPKDWIDNCRIG